MNNPFMLEPHVPKEFFCDRGNELDLMLYYLKNNTNVTLISPRRYGKTGLIYRVFDEISYRKENIDCYYVDIYSSHNLDGFITLLTESITKGTKKSTLDKFFNFIGSIRPTISYDPLTSSTQVSYTFDNIEHKQHTLKSILDFLEKQKHKVVIAIDEFQQILEYDDNINMEALLRTYIQPLQNVHFIFCGSKKHIMTNMFASTTHPFYESTQCIYLDKINNEAYKAFILKMFKLGNICINENAIDYILDLTLSHTFYTQSLCYHLFMNGNKVIAIEDVYKTIIKILNQQTETFLEQRNLLTTNQWKFLMAIAKENIVTKPLASGFIQKYHLGSAASVKRMLNSLIEKEMILVNNTIDGVEYRVYNVFLLRWLKNQKYLY